ncbi:hypothetical protein V5F77_05315 [Xanthobacter sp. DSM 24535]|uniref:hypothetical protein n=1 Tax=Roseixanthobacter psychrophilus TaxID=3119917 RepID=UPI00372C732F
MSDLLSTILTVFAAGSAIFIGSALAAFGLRFGESVGRRVFGPSIVIRVVRDDTYFRRYEGDVS